MNDTPTDVLPDFSRFKVITNEEAERRRQAERREAQRRLVERARRDWNVPERHRVAQVEFIGPWASKLDVIRQGLGKGCTWALCGTRGNGKTQMAVQAMIEATEQGRAALYTTAIQFFAQIRATFRQTSKETDLDVIACYRKPSLLVIDEIGKRGESAWEGNMLFELMNRRYADLTDTLVIANLSPEDLAASLGPSITSRLNETGGMVHCDWQGRR